MPLLTYVKFRPFVEALAEGLHDLENDELMLALSNTAPTAADGVLADIAEISYTNLSSRVLTVLTSEQIAGLYQLIIDDHSLTASGGSVGPFQYIIVFNNTAAAKNLIGFYDMLAPVTMLDSDVVNLNFDDVLGLLDIE